MKLSEIIRVVSGRNLTLTVEAPDGSSYLRGFDLLVGYDYAEVEALGDAEVTRVYARLNEEGEAVLDMRAKT